MKVKKDGKKARETTANPMLSLPSVLWRDFSRRNAAPRLEARIKLSLFRETQCGENASLDVNRGDASSKGTELL
jgi:hypothetical protein